MDTPINYHVIIYYASGRIVLNAAKRGRHANIVAMTPPPISRLRFGALNSSCSSTTILGSIDHMFDLPSCKKELIG